MSFYLSVLYVPVLYENGLTYCHNFFTVLAIIVVLSTSNTFTKFRRGHPCGGAKCTWGIKISRFCTNHSLYLANDTKYRHSYYGVQVGTHMRSIKWCHFQWPWTNPDPIFKVTPFFDAECLTNGYRYGHSYYRRRIRNLTKLANGTNFNDLEWPLTPISRSRCYSTSNNSQTVQDRAIATTVD